MAKRTAAPVQADIEEELEEESFPAAVDDDEETDDLWDDEDDAPPAMAEGDDDDEDETSDEPTSAVGDLLTPFVTSTLPAKMKRKALASQSNEWVLATIARVVDELKTVPVADRDRELILDLSYLVESAVRRKIETQLDLEVYMFAGGAIATLDEDAADVKEDAIDEAELVSTDHAAAAASLVISYVARDTVHPDPLQPRQGADAELKDSIRSLGILQPITVRRVRAPFEGPARECSHCARPWADIAAAEELMIVDGERRWSGAEDVLNTIPVIVRDDQADTYERLKTQLVANTGKPLTPIEEARTYARMLENRDVGVAALARDIGRPASTVHDRVKLLELGPWLPWIESGSVSTSMAVEHLVPLRGVPDEYHAKAVEELCSGLKPGAEVASSVEEFGDVVEEAYRAFMYPLTKTKNEWEPQPEFPVKDHDAECTCGRIDWRNRKHCGNPDWWKPLAAAAKKKAKEKAKAEGGGDAPAKGSAPNKPRLELPHGTASLSGSISWPKGVISLTDGDGKWKTCESRWQPVDAFDPADFVIDDTKLVRVKQSYGLDRVGTKDLAAVKAARDAWTKRWEKPRTAAAAKLLTSFEKSEGTYTITGAGVHAMLDAFTEVPDAEFREIAELLSIAVPKDVTNERNRRSDARRNWIAKSLKRSDAERITSFFAFLWAADKRQLPSKSIEADQQTAIDDIAKKRSPWVTTKAPKPEAKATKAAKKKSGGGGADKRSVKTKQLSIDDALAAT